jgi:hypothetical protein
MEVLIISIVAIALNYFGIIANETLLYAIFGSLIWTYAGAILYFKFGFLKRYYHDMLGWHTPDESSQRFDGVNEHAICKHCGKEIMQDSQGNWF